MGLIHRLFGVWIGGEAEALAWLASDEGRTRVRQWWDANLAHVIQVPPGSAHPADRICAGRPVWETLPASAAAEVDEALAGIEQTLQA